jgi:transcriptional regulator with XRE-family HTH domain
MNYLTVLGKNIKTIRKNNGLSQQKLAARAGFDYRYIGFLEQARINPTVKTLEKIARALNVQVCELLPSTSTGEADAFKPTERETIMMRILGKLMLANHQALRSIDKKVEAMRIH